MMQRENVITFGLSDTGPIPAGLCRLWPGGAPSYGTFSANPIIARIHAQVSTTLCSASVLYLTVTYNTALLHDGPIPQFVDAPPHLLPRSRSRTESVRVSY